MTPTDPELERQRLAKEYANMPDAQLEELAADPAGLTDLARMSLGDELKHRGLEMEYQDFSPIPEDERNELVTLRQFRDLPEALLAKGLLESAAIECYMADDNMVRLDWFISNAIGGIRLQVKRKDVEAAMEILDQPVPDDEKDEGTCDSPGDL